VAESRQASRRLRRSLPSSLRRLLPSSSSSARRTGHRDWSSPGRRIFSQLDELRTEIQRRDQELLAMSAKMKTLEEQHQDYQRHIAVLKESLCAKEEHYNMLQADVSIIFVFLSRSVANVENFDDWNWINCRRSFVNDTCLWKKRNFLKHEDYWQTHVWSNKFVIGSVFRILETRTQLSFRIDTKFSTATKFGCSLYTISTMRRQRNSVAPISISNAIAWGLA